ncbi:Ku70-binding family protein [Forsythia ovata]|uniref:Mitochondrial inner membrane protease ATP23 n=2 Tax=Forsythia ovata TaxID=205694 RepID=A0ABD1PXE1_9LAMI
MSTIESYYLSSPKEEYYLPPLPRSPFRLDPTQMANEPGPRPSSGGLSSAINDGMTVDECDSMIQRSLRTPMVKFLKEHLEKSGCNIGTNFIKAVHCDKRVSGGYVRGEGIVVCSNHLNIQDEVNQVVIHELIHAYDDCRAANLDWSDCAHHACSEIRAGHLSGDCHYKRELLRGFVKIRGHEQDCVRRRVMKSVTANPYCSEAAAKDAMEAVWDVCYNDTKPFDRAP